MPVETKCDNCNKEISSFDEPETFCNDCYGTAIESIAFFKNEAQKANEILKLTRKERDDLKEELHTLNTSRKW